MQSATSTDWDRPTVVTKLNEITHRIVMLPDEAEMAGSKWYGVQAIWMLSACACCSHVALGEREVCATSNEGMIAWLVLVYTSLQLSSSKV